VDKAHVRFQVAKTHRQHWGSGILLAFTWLNTAVYAFCFLEAYSYILLVFAYDTISHLAYVLCIFHSTFCGSGR
jgi:hypothetical protein